MRESVDGAAMTALITPAPTWAAVLIGALMLVSCASLKSQPVEATAPRVSGAVDVVVPPEIARYPALERAVQDVVERERRALAAAVASAPASTATLRLHYRVIVGNARLRVAEGNGFVMGAGAHGQAIIERQVHDVVGDRVLRIEDWFDDAEVWRVISARARAALVERFDARGNADARQRIEDGTTPVAATFERYEPLFSPEGPVLFLRVHFLPYQVAPYAAGAQHVDVPVELLMPFVRPPMRPLLTAPALSE